MNVRWLALGLPLVPYGWLTGASVLYCWWTGRLGLFIFPYCQWVEARPYWHVNWFMTVCVIGSALIPTLVIGIVIAIVARIWQERRRRRLRSSGEGETPSDIERGPTDNHGHARFATAKDMGARFDGPGCLIGAVDNGPAARLLFADPNDGPGHSLTFAGPGSGKSTQSVTRLLYHYGPRVVFDPSCELGPIMIKALQKENYNVKIIGPSGGGVNVLDWIDINDPEADAHIRSAVTWIYNDGATSSSQQKNPFWSNWGKALITCLLAHMLYSDEPEAEKTLRVLRIGIATPEAEMMKLLGIVHNTSKSDMARDIAGGLMGMRAPETFSGIYSNAFSATEWLSVGTYADAVSGVDMKTSDILDANTIVFVQVPLRTMISTPSVGRAIMGSLFNAVFHADGNVDRRILFEIDEAWSLGASDELRLCFTNGRKYNIMLRLNWQSEAQMRDVWGDKGAELIHDNISWRSYNAVQGGKVAEQLSKDIGEYSVMAYSEGDNSGWNTPRGLGGGFGSRSSGMNINKHEISRRVIKADEIMRSPANMMFVLMRDFPFPIRCFTAPYWKYPAIIEVMGANRFAIQNDRKVDNGKSIKYVVSHAATRAASYCWKSLAAGRWRSLYGRSGQQRRSTT
jgi:type IV secretion system protein VirD4